MLIFLQITVHSHLLSSVDVEELCKELLQNLKLKPVESLDISSFQLQEFDTELQFSTRIRYAQKYLRSRADFEL